MVPNPPPKINSGGGTSSNAVKPAAEFKMKFLKEPLSRLANKQDGCPGTLWEQRFKSIATTMDTEALLATSIYIDLNVFAAGLAGSPETSPHTSIKQRVRILVSAR